MGYVIEVPEGFILVKHWAKQLGVSSQQLRTAIEQVGPLVDAVRQHLKMKCVPITLGIREPGNLESR
jgi:hypothetical protein